MDNDNRTNIEDSADAPANAENFDVGKSGKKRGISVWTLVFSVLLAILVTFQATYITLTLKYGTELDRFRAKRSSVSSGLGRAYSLIDEISELYEKYYLYDVDYDALIEDLVEDYVYETGDPYAQYYTAKEWEHEMQVSEGSSAGIGALIYPITYEDTNIIKDGIYITQVMSDGPAKAVGVCRGDIITAIDGQSVIGMNYYRALALAAGSYGSSVKITVMRGDEELDFDIVRSDYSYETILSNAIERNGVKVGYVRMTDFYESTFNDFKEAVEALKKEGCEGLIFDIRANGGGYLGAISEVLDYILPSGPIVRITYADGTESVVRSDAGCISDTPIVVLIDEDTASAAELFAAALRDYDYATVIGVKSYGKGCGQHFFRLSNGAYVKLTTFYYSPPYSDNYDGVGVSPDIEVRLEGSAANKNALIITEEEDNQLDYAVNYLLNKIK